MLILKSPFISRLKRVYEKGHSVLLKSKLSSKVLPKQIYDEILKSLRWLICLNLMLDICHGIIHKRHTISVANRNIYYISLIYVFLTKLFRIFFPFIMQALLAQTAPQSLQRWALPQRLIQTTTTISSSLHKRTTRTQCPLAAGTSS